MLPLKCLPTYYDTTQCSHKLIFSLLASYRKNTKNNILTNSKRKQKKPPKSVVFCAPTGIRILVITLKGLRPGPLDDGGVLLNCFMPLLERAGFYHYTAFRSSIFQNEY